MFPQPCPRAALTPRNASEHKLRKLSFIAPQPPLRALGNEHIVPSSGKLSNFRFVSECKVSHYFLYIKHLRSLFMQN